MNKTDKESKASKEETGWVKKYFSRKKIKAISSTIITVIATIAVLINYFNTIANFVHDKFFRKTAEIKEVKPKETLNEVSRACTNLKVKTFSVFPYYLVNSYNRAPDTSYMCWAAVTGKNTSAQPLLIRIRFKPDPPNAEVKREEIDTGVGPFQEIGEEKGRKDPGLMINARTDKDFFITGEWKIYDMGKGVVGNTCNQDQFSIRVIRENHVYWDLKNLDNQPADIGFLLASLSAWSILPQNPPQELKERATIYYSQGGAPETWLKACYNDLFRSSNPIKVHRFTDPWPLRGQGLQSIQGIRTWEMILTGRKADSLEAALLIGALKDAMSSQYEDLKFRLVLFALPLDPANDQGEKRFLLAWAPKASEWRPVDPKEWRAINLSAPNDLDCDLNVRQASSLLSQVLQTQGEKIIPLLNKQGVFYDQTKPLARQSLLALDFHIASQYYYIAGLRGE
jgi:hypothetical protein